MKSHDVRDELQGCQNGALGQSWVGVVKVRLRVKVKVKVKVSIKVRLGSGLR